MEDERRSRDLSYDWATWPVPGGLAPGKKYRHAPIVEAILELRVENDPSLTVDKLDGVSEPHCNYQEPQPDFNVTGSIQFVEGNFVGDTTSQQVGFTITREDGARAIQAHLNRFAFIWRAPYVDWDAFTAEAERAWLTYREVSGTMRVVHAAVRFVNRLDIPKHTVEIKDYLRISVDIPPYLPQGITNLFMQVDVPLEPYQVLATITSALAPPVQPEWTSLILDIDAKRSSNLDAGDPTFDAALSSILADLRKAKNYVFEACITDATRGLIQ